jgi:hypothetical protein
MTPHARLTALGATGVVTMVAAFAFGVSTDFGVGLGVGGNDTDRRSGNVNATPPSKALVVTQVGSTAVGPGTPGSMTVKVANPNNQPVILTAVSTQVTSIGSSRDEQLPRCDKTWISVAPWSGSRTIKAKGDATLTVATSFSNLPTVNQSSCKDVTFGFDFTASGRQA